VAFKTRSAGALRLWAFVLIGGPFSRRPVQDCKIKHPPKVSQQASDSFEAVAKRLECDEDKGRFEAKLGKIAKATLPAAGKKKS
jgi:hypothetical protein